MKGRPNKYICKAHQMIAAALMNWIENNAISFNQSFHSSVGCRIAIFPIFLLVKNYHRKRIILYVCQQDRETFLSQPLSYRKHTHTRPRVRTFCREPVRGEDGRTLMEGLQTRRLISAVLPLSLRSGTSVASHKTTPKTTTPATR